MRASPVRHRVRGRGPCHSYARHGDVPAVDLVMTHVIFLRPAGPAALNMFSIDTVLYVQKNYNDSFEYRIEFRIDAGKVA